MSEIERLETDTADIIAGNVVGGGGYDRGRRRNRIGHGRVVTHSLEHFWNLFCLHNTKVKGERE